MADLELLDQSVAKLLEAVKDFPPEEIEELIAAERTGKTRLGAINGLMALLPGEDEEGPEAEYEPVPSGNIITNCIKGTTLHLGDSRKLAYGESAEVPADLAARLRESGQAE